MMMIAIVALAAVQAAGSAPGPVTSAHISDARRALDERLFDYPTARFRDVRGNGFVLCGLVNAKNRMGAYAGWKRFAWISGSDDPRLLSDEEAERDDVLLDAFCGEDGLQNQGRDYSREITYQR